MRLTDDLLDEPVSPELVLVSGPECARAARESLGRLPLPRWEGAAATSAPRGRVSRENGVTASRPAAEPPHRRGAGVVAAAAALGFAAAAAGFFAGTQIHRTSVGPSTDAIVPVARLPLRPAEPSPPAPARRQAAVRRPAASTTVRLSTPAAPALAASAAQDAGGRRPRPTTAAPAPTSPARTPSTGTVASPASPQPAAPSLPVLHWQAVSHADSYWIAVSSSESRRPGVELTFVTREPTLAIPSTWNNAGRRRSLEAGRYRWKVWAVANGAPPAPHGESIAHGTFVVS